MVDLQAGADLHAAPVIETDEALARRRSKAGNTKRGATARSGTQAAVQQRAPGARSSSGKVAAASAERAPARAASRNATSGSATAGKSAAHARSGAQANTAPARATPNRQPVEPTAGYGHGMMLDDNPFNQAFGNSSGQAALELEADERAVPAAPSSVPAAPAEPQENVTQKRARQMREIASYGPVPEKPLGAPMYCVRVMLRKRELSDALKSLSAQRKRADDQANEALVKVGEAFYALRDEGQLAELTKQLNAVTDASARVGDVEARDQQRKQNSTQELARIDRELAACEREAAPLRARESELLALLEDLKAEGRRVEMQRRKLETELEATRRTKAGVDPERLAAMQAEHDARHGELQTLGIQTRPLEDDLGGVRRELAKHMRAIAVLQSEKQTTVTALERASQNHRVSFGTAKDGYQQALISLANGGLKLGFGELVPTDEQAAFEAAERAGQKRAQEELHRAALNSYDPKVYSRGLTMLLGGSVAMFLTLALLVFL
jgi:hypothetical protein